MQRSIESFGNVQQMRDHLAATLKPHQKRHVVRLVAQRRILIADETGTGKTASALAALEETGQFPAAVVTPASNEEGFQRQCLQWLPWRSAGICTDAVPSTEIVILHPESLDRHAMGLLRRGIKAVLIDESHYFKNPASGRSRAVRDLAGRCDVRILMSATPIKNRRSDLLHQLRLLGRLDEVMIAAYRIAGKSLPAVNKEGNRTWGLAGLDPQVLHQALEETVMVRTTHTQAKTGVAIVKRHEIKCEGADSKDYRELEDQFVAYCKEVSMLDPKDTVARSRSRIRAAKILNDMRTALGAAKVNKLQEWAVALKAAGRRGVVFTYHRSVAEMLVSRLPGRTGVITGATPRKQRQRIVDHMAGLDFLVATMDTMSHAIDGLQHHAQDLAFVELDHTHSKHEQAEGRLRRDGQRRAVQASYLVAPSTYDEAMLAALAVKWKDAAGIIDGKRGARTVNFAEVVLGNVIQQRPWETGKPIDWKAAAKTATVARGNRVSKPGRAGPMEGDVIWVNTSHTSCRVEWAGGLVTFEVPSQLRVLADAATPAAS